ncbi:hypothetical protein EDD17DRAFT_1592032 [Pisolithus thermaeus]|nr:hypothetical protein EDD17DRAFT_1592032 [Pisolithus thermaeus]
MARQRWLSGEPLALQALSAAVLYGASAFLFLSFFLSQTSGNDEGWWISDKRPRVWHRQRLLLRSPPPPLIPRLIPHFPLMTDIPF